MNYTGIGDWLITLKDINDYWTAHPSFAVYEQHFLIGSVIALVHAFKTGGRWPWLFFTAMFHGMIIELVCYFLPFVQNFWHAQGIITLFGHRMPLYVAIIHPLFYYHASWAVSKLKLKSELVEHMAVGLLTVLIDMPYDLIGTKFVHWIWHDTDPGLYDRNLWSPWNLYNFNLCFSFSFHYWFHSIRGWIEKRKDLDKWQAGSLKSEIIASLGALSLGFPGGFFLFSPIYQPLHYFFEVSTEVITVAFLLTCSVIVWKFDRKSDRYQKPSKMNLISKLLFGHLVVHYLINLGTVIFFSPENVVAIGLHQTVGNCNETEPVVTFFKTLQRNKYLCVDNYDEKYYDFHCLPNAQPPSEGSTWYTVCGTPFENRAEYITIISLITFIAYVVFTSIHFDYDRNVERIWKKVDLPKKRN